MKQTQVHAGATVGKDRAAKIDGLLDIQGQARTEMPMDELIYANRVVPPKQQSPAAIPAEEGIANLASSIFDLKAMLARAIESKQPNAAPQPKPVSIQDQLDSKLGSDENS